MTSSADKFHAHVITKPAVPRQAHICRVFLELELG